MSDPRDRAPGCLSRSALAGKPDLYLNAFALSWVWLGDYVPSSCIRVKNCTMMGTASLLAFQMNKQTLSCWVTVIGSYRRQELGDGAGWTGTGESHDPRELVAGSWAPPGTQGP